MQQRAAREEALYRSQTFIMDSLRSLSLQFPGASIPSADAYSAHVAWPQYPGDQDTSAGGDDADADDEEFEYREFDTAMVEGDAADVGAEGDAGDEGAGDA